MLHYTNKLCDKSLYMKIIEKASIKFGSVIGFQKEVTNPQQIKYEMDKLIKKLNENGIKHKNIAISKVLEKNIIKKTILIEASIVVDDGSIIEDFIINNPKYNLINDYCIEAGYMVSIANNANEFKSAIKLLMQTFSGENTGIDSYNLDKNKIIEVSRIAYDGTVLGFDLYWEKVIEETSHDS